MSALEQALGTTLGVLGGPAPVPTIGDLVTFVGFLGGSVKQPGGKQFQLLYLDPALQSWLLVEEDGIRRTDKLRDDMAPFRERDIIWVDADAAVGRGRGPQSIEARFLTGEFTRAGDFEARLTGGTIAASTGVFCEAKTPLCCTRHSR